MTIVPSRSWGGLGNMLPIYATFAKTAFANNCTVVFNESGRFFQLSDVFEPPPRIPRGWRADGSGYHANCAVRALTARPTAAVRAKVRAVEARLRTTHQDHGGPPPRPMTPCLREMSECCIPTGADGAPHRRLVGLQIRTMWADQRLLAAQYECAEAPVRRAHHIDDASSADAFLAQTLTPNFDAAPTAKASRNASVPSSVRVLVDAVVRRAEMTIPNGEPWSLFVASDAPALRAAIRRHAAARGIDVMHTHGTVGHNNQPLELRGGTRAAFDEARNAAVTAAADVLILSRSDLLLAVHESMSSSFSRAARRMSVCPLPHAEWHLHANAFWSLPLMSTLWRNASSGGTSSAAESAHTAREASLEDVHGMDCARDCLGALPVTSHEVDGALLLRARNASTRSAACRHACSCWLKAALGDGSERHLHASLTHMRLAEQARSRRNGTGRARGG